MFGTNDCCGAPAAVDRDDPPSIATERRSFLKGLGAAAGVAAIGGTAGADADDEDDEADVETDEADNAIVFITDGKGPAMVTGARYLKAYREDADEFPLNANPDRTPLAMDSHEAHGTMTTYPDDPNEVVTDSAAGATSPGTTDCAASATSLGTGVKTYNGAIGGYRNEDGEFVETETILEAARDAGKATGLVTTTRITHATPAAFAAHVPHRDMEDEIAAQYVDDADVDVLLGGGRAHFDPDERDDGRDLLGDAAEEGYEIVETADELDDVDEAPVLGLFTEDGSHMDYYLDRESDDSDQPGLVEMTETAVDLLSENDDGFFLMVESGRVDHAAHNNDPAILAEQLEGDEAVGAALDFARDEDTDPTTVVTTADHECGGFSLARDGVYNVDFEMIDRLDASVTEGLLPAIDEEVETVDDLREVTEDVAGIELGQFDQNLSEADLHRSIDLSLYTDLGEVRRLLNRQMLLGFTSHGHTGVDVPLYADGPNAEFFARARDNTDIAPVLAETLGLDS